MKAEILKRKFWDAVRPLHAPLSKAARKRLGRNYFEHPEMELPPAYEAVQLEAERRLHCYLHVSPQEIRQIVIVGASNGEEIPRLHRSYPNARFLCFEPSPKSYRELAQKFREDFIATREMALSDRSGAATFYELPLGGNGSLLRPDAEQWSDFTQSDDNEVASFQVSVSTLDREAAELKKIDLLWMDVQGAEGNVLRGATETLRRVSAVFLEIALIHSPYEGTLLFPELQSMLRGCGFLCVGLGLDGWNYSGNALWVRPPLHQAPFHH
jgi:FkbM family methyltransferase